MTPKIHLRKWITHVSLGIHGLTFIGLGLTTLGFVWLGWLFLPVPLLWVSQHPCIGGHWLHAPRLRQEAEDGGLNTS